MVAAAVALIIAASPRCLSTTGPTVLRSEVDAELGRAFRMQHAVVGRGVRRRELVVEPRVRLVQWRQVVGHGRVDAEPARDDARPELRLIQPGHERVVAVADHSGRRHRRERA